MPLYPDVVVELRPDDKNPIFILGFVKRALERGNVPRREVERFYAEATSGDYQNLIEVCKRWVTFS
jgi:hypothetical protein